MATVERGLRPTHIPERKGGINKRIAALALTGVIAAGGAGIWAASQQGEQPRPQPTTPGGIGGSPTPEVTPTITIAPTETPVVTPSPEVTPTPTPEPTPTPMPLESIIEADHPAVKIEAVKDAVTNLYETNPKAESIYPYALPNLTTCETGDNDPNPKIALYNRQDTCNRLVANLFKVYKSTGDINAYNAALDAYNYSISKYGLGPTYKEMLDEYLKSL